MKNYFLPNIILTKYNKFTVYVVKLKKKKPRKQKFNKKFCEKDTKIHLKSFTYVINVAHAWTCCWVPKLVYWHSCLILDPSSIFLCFLVKWYLLNKSRKYFTFSNCFKLFRKNILFYWQEKVKFNHMIFIKPQCILIRLLRSIYIHVTLCNQLGICHNINTLVLGAKV